MNDIETALEACEFVYDTVSEIESTEQVSVCLFAPSPGSVAGVVIVVQADGVTLSPTEFVIPVQLFLRGDQGDVQDVQREAVRFTDLIDQTVGGESLGVSGRLAWLDANAVWVGDFTVTVPRTL